MIEGGVRFASLKSTSTSVASGPSGLRALPSRSLLRVWVLDDDERELRVAVHHDLVVLAPDPQELQVVERVEDEVGLRAALDSWWSPSEVPKVLEIVTSGPESADAHRRYMEAVRP